ncbi:MAG TPA: 3-isopropylmalate dehydratase large subunit [Aquifex aeolicus]|uniref:3-isopropylmalate dehydratase large subunit n=1 Tax=Aquifex aeolicus TaxID=63363 RepID=A0A7C5LA20_AQUAO|nr:3-isopropylmalate dehydratase large subunit [Aquifex aeolicus]
MGMTITEKILADHAGKREVFPGDLITARIDLAMANDVTAPLAIKILEKYSIDGVFDPERIALVLSHFVPAKDIKSAEQAKLVREFARRHGIRWFFEEGEGIEHTILPERGIVVPGDLVVGADSHTCTYGGIGAFATGVGSTDIAYAMATGEIWLKVPESMKFIFYGRVKPWVMGKDIILHTIGEIGVDGALYRAMEFDGEAIRELSVEQRLTIANMAIEAGGKSGIIPPDEKTLAYVRERAKKGWKIYESDPDAEYHSVYEWDAGTIEPLVAWPYLPSNVKPVSESTHVRIDQAFIGSCTNGRIEDLRIAAKVFESALKQGKKVHPYVRCIVIPASKRVYHQALHEGLIDLFLEAGCVVSTSTCGPCLGGHMGVLAEGERCISTSNRNFPGRMGHPKSESYLANPAVVAASAVLGRIAHPEEVVRAEELAEVS